jgi:hypothetical protein
MTRQEESITINDIKLQEKGKPYLTNIYQVTLIKLKEKVSIIDIRPSTIALVIKYVMEIVEETPLKGVEQKELSIKLFREIIKDLTDGDDEKVLLKLLEDGTISNMIDLIVDATKGKLNINSIDDVTLVASGCINNCLPYFKGTFKKKEKKSKINATGTVKV